MGRHVDYDNSMAKRHNEKTICLSYWAVKRPLEKSFRVVVEGYKHSCKSCKSRQVEVGNGSSVAGGQLEDFSGPNSRCDVSGDCLEPYNRWQSSFIKRRIERDLVETASGSRYRLIGKCDVKRSKANNIPAAASKSFAEGFPVDWENVILSGGTKNRARSSKTTGEKPRRKSRVKTECASREGMGTKISAKKALNESSNESHDQALDVDEVCDQSFGEPNNQSLDEENSLSLDEENNQSMDETPNQSLDETPNQSLCDSTAYNDVSSTRRTKKIQVSYVEKSENDSSSSVNDDVKKDDEPVETFIEDVDTMPLPSSETSKMRTGLPWTVDELRRLRRAHAHCTARPDRFWAVISRRVASRTQQECYNKWLLSFATKESLHQKPARPLKAKKEYERGDLKNGTNSDKAPKKLAGKDTAKYRKQVRDMFSVSAEDAADDAFNTTPFKNTLKKRRERKKAENSMNEKDTDEQRSSLSPKRRLSSDDFNFNTNINTPNTTTSNQQDTPVESSSSDESQKVDRTKVDKYIIGMAKRRKAPKLFQATSNYVGVAAKENDTGTTMVDNGLVKGVLTPQGSVKIKCDVNRMAYEWSDDEESEEEEDD